MIEYIKGEIAELSPASAIIDCNGLGYAANISLNTYAAIQGRKAANCISTKLSVKMHMSSRFCRQTRTRTVPATDFRIGHWRQYGTYDSLCPFACRTGECDQYRK